MPSIFKVEQSDITTEFEEEKVELKK